MTYRKTPAASDTAITIAATVAPTDIPGDWLVLGDALITSAQLSALAGGVSAMTIWRWCRVGLLPPPTRIRNRNYWSRRKAIAALAAAAEGTARLGGGAAQ